jgi:hypothetical protein
MSGRRPSRRTGWSEPVRRMAEGPVTLKTADVAQISGDILGQIYARDFKMIDQSDMIVSLVPELPGGKPALSSGVERELHHAYEGGKEAYVIWPCKAAPSPFITQPVPGPRGVADRLSHHASRRESTPSGRTD